jgi:putative ABC transport system permease protein
MFQHNLLLIYRSVKRYKGSFFINLIGLSTGLACSILILLWVQNEISYDRFHIHADNIYRITAEVRDERLALSSYPLTTILRSEMPEVKNTVRLRPDFGVITLFEVGGRKFEEKGLFYAEPSFFQIFSFSLIEGDRETALVKPDGVIISKRIAQRYFGSESAMGKTIRINNTDDLIVVGVLEDIPATSHLQFDFLLPMSSRERIDETIIYNLWDNFNFYTYVQLEDGTDAASVKTIVNKLGNIFKTKTSSFEANFELQPLNQIHLYSDFKYDVDGNGSIQYVRIFSIAAIFVLLVACVNFMNLATARSSRRAREVGVRKVIGADRSGLIRQFLAESLTITFAAFLLSIVFVVAVLPFFNELSGKYLEITFGQGKLFIALLFIFFVTSLISGSYPAFFLSNFQTVQVLKGRIMKAGTGSIRFRNILVVFQFSVSIVLFVCAVFIYNQLRFIQKRNLGYDKENLVYIPLKGDMNTRTERLEQILESNSDLLNYSFVSELPTNVERATVGVSWQGKEGDFLPMFSVMEVDQNFLEVFKVQLLNGRGYSKDFGNDSTSYIVNEKALKIIGFTEASAIGQPLRVFGKNGTIIGVVKDFNFKPIQQPIESMVLRLSSRPDYVVLRTKPGATAKSIASLKNIWQSLNSSYNFEYGFIDEDLTKLYATEQRMGILFTSFAVLAIFISFLGLSGLVAFISEQRTKEIGIRKVLGASVPGVITLLSLDFVKLVLVAFVIATPLAWYGMHEWLEAYAYRTNMDWRVFGVAGILALLIAICTTAFQSIKTALMNPVKSLRSE